MKGESLVALAVVLCACATEPSQIRSGGTRAGRGSAGSSSDHPGTRGWWRWRSRSRTRGAPSTTIVRRMGRCSLTATTINTPGRSPAPSRARTLGAPPRSLRGMSGRDASSSRFRRRPPLRALQLLSSLDYWVVGGNTSPARTRICSPLTSQAKDDTARTCFLLAISRESPSTERVRHQDRGARSPVEVRPALSRGTCSPTQRGAGISSTRSRGDEAGLTEHPLALLGAPWRRR